MRRVKLVFDVSSNTKKKVLGFRKKSRFHYNDILNLTRKRPVFIRTKVKASNGNQLILSAPAFKPCALNEVRNIRDERKR